MFTRDSRYSNRLMLKNVYAKTIKFKKYFFPSGILDWNKLDLDIKTSKSKNVFKKRVLNKIRSKRAPYFGLRDNDMVRHITILRLGLSPLNAHKHKYNFIESPHPFCQVCEIIEDTTHFLLLCKSFRLSRSTLMHNISSILGFEVSSLPKKKIVEILLYGKEGISNEKNRIILEEVSSFIDCSKRFERKRIFTLSSVPRVGGGIRFFSFLTFFITLFVCL